MTPDDARELFCRGRRAKRELDLLEAHRSRLLAGVGTSGVPTIQTGGDTSDPTGRAANVLVDMSDEWAAEEATLRAEIDECRALCVGVGRAFTLEYQIILENRYLLDMEWKQIAHALDRSIRTIYNMANAAYEYVAYVGPVTAKAGHGRAEE